MSTPLRSRVPSLDGLRALAVTGVVLFHGGVSWLPGGFLGVDLFFVLSGYLITSLLLGELADTGRVDLRAFWTRRARRLLPPLLVVVTAVVVVNGQTLATPARSLRDDALAALGYVANWRFVTDGTGYFAQYSDPSPLQHTWSLGIEEQFYLLWPLLLVLLVRARSLVAATAAGLAASVALMAWGQHHGWDPSRLYFGTDTHAQSLLVGVLLATALRRLTARTAASGPAPEQGPVGAVASGALAAGGLLASALLWTSLDGDSSQLYDGGFLVAAAGAAAMVAAVALHPSGLPARALGCWPLRSLGRISYAVYLWHWPVQLFLTGERTGLSGGALLATRVAVDLVLATASWWLLERPVQLWVPVGWPALQALATSAVVVAAVVCIASQPPVVVPVLAAAPVVTELPTAPPPPATTRPASTTAPARRPVATTTPVAVTTTRPAPLPHVPVTVLGDSVAESLARGMAATSSRLGYPVTNGGIVGCGVQVGTYYKLAGKTYHVADECVPWESRWRRSVAGSAPKRVAVLVGRHEILDFTLDGQWTHIGTPAADAYLEAQLRKGVLAAQHAGARVSLLSTPCFHRPEAADGRRFPENDPHRVELWNAIQRRVAAATGARYVDLYAKTCPGGRYATYVDGVYVRNDGVHFSPQGAAWLAPWLLPRL